MDVTLRPVDQANRSAVEALQVSPAQHDYVAGVSESIVEAAETPQAMPWYRAIYAGDEPVGFVMISDNIPPGDPQLLGPYFLWRLLVDQKQQGHGYGAAAVQLVVEYLRDRPGATELLTSVVPGPGCPIGFYLRQGFYPTGQVFGGELVLTLPLAIGPG